MFTASDLYTMLMAAMSAVATVASITWFMSNQFSKLRNMVYERVSKTETALLEKIEYHERHDDRRFHDLRNDLWTVKLQVAANTAAREKRLAMLSARRDADLTDKLKEDD